MRGCLITGTGTGVGKTVLTAALAASLVARAQRVGVFKPVVTGTAHPTPVPVPVIRQPLMDA